MKSYLVCLDWFYRVPLCVKSLWLLTSMGRLIIVVADFSLGSVLVFSLVALALDVEGSQLSALLVMTPLDAEGSWSSVQALFVGDSTSEW